MTTRSIILATVVLAGWSPALAGELHQAVRIGDVDSVKQLIEKGVDVNQEDTAFGTPLHLAALIGDEILAELLIANGADINAKITSDAMTPLHMAARNGDVAVIELLIANSADIEAKDQPDGATPMHWAARFGNLGAADLLLRKGANISAETVDGYKPIHDAALNNKGESIEFLIGHGADVNATASARSETPLYVAAKFGNLSAVERLLDLAADPNGRGAFSPLRAAVGEGQEDVAELLRQHGATE